MSVSTALNRLIQIWFLFHHFLYFRYTRDRFSFWVMFEKLSFISLINFVNAFITAFPSETVSTKPVCWEGDLCRLIFSTFCRIFIANNYLPMRVIILFMKNLISVHSFKRQIIFAVESVNLRWSLVWYFRWHTISFQAVIMSWHSIISIIQNNFFVCVWHLNSEVSNKCINKLFRSSRHLFLWPQWENGIQFAEWGFLTSEQFWILSASKMTERKQQRLSLFKKPGVIFIICRSDLFWCSIWSIHFK